MSSLAPARDVCLSLCTFRAGGEIFALETPAVREALRAFSVRSVPLAPAFVRGVLPYRGDMLTVICLRTLLGLAPAPAAVCALVLRDTRSGELFALLIDALADVVQFPERDWEPNPPMLDRAHADLLCGAYRTNGEPVARLDLERIQPSWWLRQG